MKIILEGHSVDVTKIWKVESMYPHNGNPEFENQAGLKVSIIDKEPIRINEILPKNLHGNDCRIKQEKYDVLKDKLKDLMSKHPCPEKILTL